MSILSALDIAKSHGPQVVLAGVSVTIEERERVGLVGLNGSGKSTLCRILAGEETPDTGVIHRRRNSHIAYLSQEPELPAGKSPKQIVLSGLELWSRATRAHHELSETLAKGTGNVESLLQEQAQLADQIERLGGWEVEHQAETFMQRLGVAHLDRPVETLSGGERRRVALARLLISKPDLAILDEPTNHLDAETIEWLEEHFCSSFPGALLVITHDRAFLDTVVQRTAEIERGKLYLYSGGWEEYLMAKSERLALAVRTEGNRQNFLRRELEWLRRQPKARTGKQKARIDRATAAQVAKPAARQQSAEMSLEATRLGGTILVLQDVGLQLGEKQLVRGLTLHVTAGSRIGIVGPNGAGKTSLLRVILGDLPPTTGTARLGERTTISYFDQTRSTLDLDKTVKENVAGDRDHVAIGGKSQHIYSYLERLLFDKHAAGRKARDLSGGEQARVALAKLLVQESNVIVLDEPTNDLDTDTLAALEVLLTDFGGVVLLVTHDRYFLNRVATSILGFEGAGSVIHQEGDYDLYRTQRDFRRAALKAPSAEAARRSSAPEPSTKKRTGLTHAEKKELAALPDRIEAADANVVRIQERLADPAVYASGATQAAALSVELEVAQRGAAELLSRWESLAERHEAAG